MTATSSIPEVKQRFSFGVKPFGVRHRSLSSWRLGTCPIPRPARRRRRSEQGNSTCGEIGTETERIALDRNRCLTPTRARRAATDLVRLPRSCETSRRDRSADLRRRADPRDADVRGRDRAPHRGDRACRPARGRPAPERGRAGRGARDLQADPAAGAPRARAVRARRGAARQGGRDLRRDRPRARRRDLHRGEARGGRGVDVLRARRVLERAVAHEAMRTATAADLVELEPNHRPARASPRRAVERDASRRDVPPRAGAGVPQRDDPGGDAGRRARARPDPRRVLGRRRLRPADARRPPPPARRDRAARRGRARGGAGRALPHARDAVRRGIGRRWSELFGARAKPRPAP